MKESCGCKVIVDPKTQFETIDPCEKHDTWRRFGKYMLSNEFKEYLDKNWDK